MPKLLFARPPLDATEERTIRKLATSRHAPADWIARARMLLHRWGGLRTTAIAAELHCHPQTVRERRLRFHAEGIEGLGDRPGTGRKPRLTAAARRTSIGLVRRPPPGRPVRDGEGSLPPAEPEQPPQWSLDALAAAAHAHGVQVSRSQVRRILQAEGVRWRRTRTWATRHDPDVAPNEPPSARAPPPHPPARRRSASTHAAR